MLAIVNISASKKLLCNVYKQIFTVPPWSVSYTHLLPSKFSEWLLNVIHFTQCLAITFKSINRFRQTRNACFKLTPVNALSNNTFFFIFETVALLAIISAAHKHSRYIL